MDFFWVDVMLLNVDVYCDGNVIVIMVNDGVYIDVFNVKGGGSYSY